MANAQTLKRTILRWHETPQSSNVVRFANDATDLTKLIVEFKSGTYEYSDVPVHVSTSMILAPSKGQFLCAEIKPVYPCRKLLEAEAESIEQTEDFRIFIVDGENESHMTLSEFLTINATDLDTCSEVASLVPGERKLIGFSWIQRSTGSAHSSPIIHQQSSSNGLVF